MITAAVAFHPAAYDWRHLSSDTGCWRLNVPWIWLRFADDSPQTARWVSTREKHTSSTRKPRAGA